MTREQANAIESLSYQHAGAPIGIEAGYRNGAGSLLRITRPDGFEGYMTEAGHVDTWSSVRERTA